MKNKFEVKKQQEKREEKVQVSKSTILRIDEILPNEDAVIVNIDGWRIRAYFDESMKKEQKSFYHEGKEIEVKYFGNIEDVHSVRLLPLK